ncbi:MAG: hypothetical protein C4551_06275 [Bacillota bacterium]|nr:MAG: hypothetical protein C4551_06275 [Bacillota bacterium]
MPDDTPLTEEELAAIEARANEADPGLWEAVRLSGTDGPCAIRTPYGGGSTRYGLRYGFRQIYRWENAVFAAHARTDIDRLVAEVRQSRQTVQRCREALHAIQTLSNRLKEETARIRAGEPDAQPLSDGTGGDG